MPFLAWQQHKVPSYPKGRCFAADTTLIHSGSSPSSVLLDSLVFWIDAGSLTFEAQRAQNGETRRSRHEVMFKKEFQEGSNLRLRVLSHHNDGDPVQEIAALKPLAPPPGSALNLTFEPLSPGNYLVTAGAQMTFLCHEISEQEQ